MKRRGAARLLFLATALAAPFAADAVAADLWRWIDADGVPRYTPSPDRVPAGRRSTLERVEPGMAAAPAREPALAQPPAIFAPPGDPALAADPFNEPERARELEGEVVEGEVVVEMPAAGAPDPVPPAPPGEAEPLHSVDAAPETPEPAQAARGVAPPPEPAAPRTKPPVAAQPALAPRSEPSVASPPVAAPRSEPPVASAPVAARSQPAAAVLTAPALDSQPAPPVATPTTPPRFHGEVVVDVPSADPAAAAPAAGQPEPPAAAEPPRPVEAGPAPPAETAPAPASAASSVDRAARRAELLAAIARDEEALKAHVSAQDSGQLVASPELREIAERLPALQAELRALDAQSAAP